MTSDLLKQRVAWRMPLASMKVLALQLVSAWVLSACGGGGDGPAVRAAPQSLDVDAAPAMTVGGTFTVRAQASSGLPVRYDSLTPDICGVQGDGKVTALTHGECVITVAQDGNADFAPAQTAIIRLTIEVDPHQVLQWQTVAELTLGGTVTVAAQATSGLTVRYGSQTPGVCAVVPETGVVSGLTMGDCIVTADQAGDARWLPAPQVQRTLPVVVPPGVTVPPAPADVRVEAADAARAVIVKAGATSSGGSPITHYTVRSTSGAVSVQVASLPAVVDCAGSCRGLGFTVSASNMLGEGAASGAAHIVTRYEATAIFHEPDTQPRDSVFEGSFLFDATTGEVSGLQGTLTESMTGDPSSSGANYGMTLLSLTHQLSAVHDPALGGVLVTTFLLPTTDTFTRTFGGDGWSPGTGFGLYAGFPTAPNPSAGGVGNAYVRLFVNLDEPTAALTDAQIDKLAYADCAAGGMMGATCMTGTTVAGYGSIGTMSGYPVSLVIRKAR